jgi:hypothetical protein
VTTAASATRTSRVCVAVFVCALALSVASCGNGRKPLYPVQGRVVDGRNKPAFNALVVFHPTDPTGMAGILPQGRVDESGNFKLMTYEKDDGAPAGSYNVTVFWQRPQTSPFDGDGPDILAGRYNDSKTSKISFTVEAKSSNVVPDIQVQIAPGMK